VVIVFVRLLRLVVDLHFVSVVHWHPRLPRFYRDTNEDSCIVVFILHAEDDANLTVAEFLSRPVEQTHAAMGFDQPLFHSHSAGAHMLPSGQIFPVEQWLPLLRLCRTHKSS